MNGALELVIPWVLPSKKNRTNPRAGRHGRDAVITANEESIHAIALATLALELGVIDRATFCSIRDIAEERRTPRSGFGRAALDLVVGNLPNRIRAAFGDHDVAVELVEHIGARPAEDGTVITIRDLGAPTKRKRTGRRHDLANVPAIALDAIQGVAYDDDRQVVDLRIRREYGGVDQRC